MINRELIRLKVVQLAYAHMLNEDKRIEAVDKELTYSISKAYDLYQNLLLLIVELHQIGKFRYEAQCRRIRGIHSTEMPSPRLVNNRFAEQLTENKQLLEYAKKKNFSWTVEDAFVRNLQKEIADSPLCEMYMDAEEDSYQSDKDFWRRAYKGFISNNDGLDAILEEQSLYWNDDKHVVDSFVIKTIKRFDEASGADQPLLPEFEDEDDERFAHQLLSETLSRSDEFDALIEASGKNWDLKRMALMDVVIVKVALAEILTFPLIPLVVTFNEYLNLASLYSTPRSTGYVNGILDTIVRRFIDEGTISKEMTNKTNNKKNKED